MYLVKVSMMARMGFIPPLDCGDGPIKSTEIWSLGPLVKIRIVNVDLFLVFILFH